MTDTHKQAADEDAAYLWQLINKQGVPLNVAVHMVVARIHARIAAEGRKPPKEPWQQ